MENTQIGLNGQFHNFLLLSQRRLVRAFFFTEICFYAKGACVFPFTTGGHTFHSCTHYRDSDGDMMGFDKPWCATKTTADGKYDYGHWE